MSNNKKMNEAVTSRDADFAQWYTDLCLKAELMDYSDVKGFIIYRPYGYAIWENIQSHLDRNLKETNHQNVYMPLVIPESLFQKEKDHVAGFAPETAMITTTGVEDLAERLIVRPTSETLFCTHYNKIINSYRDLPKLYNQWCSVVRWEKTTRPFLRGKEFLWQEGHTAHATEVEARKETLDILQIYKDLGKDLLAIPFVTGKKTEKEKFAGAIDTYSIEALMHDGQALQSGTTHYFGQNFAKAFDITFQDEKNQQQFVHQTSWGVSTRLIGAVIMVHGDDEGLVLPPYVAPTQVVIIPIQSKKEEVKAASSHLFTELKKAGYRVQLDDTDKSAGWKFSEYEMKGVPVRIEIGPRDLERNEVTLVTRHDRTKHVMKVEDVLKEMPIILRNMHDTMYDRALKHVEANTYQAKNYDEFKAYIIKGGYVAMSISGEEAEIQIKKDTSATARVIPFDQTPITDICPVTHKKATQTVWFARAY
ncbi:MAG TPA: proline--tRNA ligase [Acholeplasmataceae bacterium]|nr:MAG: proline--tRNA ligase [Tenericutes bacterium GWA2_38_26]OHE30386.1 MAG: proline--tRNA ligase [Tenericutes bacterium GWC2_39_45]OHE31430.1 MAG: proline--tRNA ligase [Tenericutes bacterium GWD2_38_27]HBG32401.1 proline--tRNA ligase [Acholeplasmataceae bacterium]HBY65249.1 proline--tRNA ligase [Acholeplasmataceae bacterium]